MKNAIKLVRIHLSYHKNEWHSTFNITRAMMSKRVTSLQERANIANNTVTMQEVWRALRVGLKEGWVEFSGGEKGLYKYKEEI